MKKIFALVLIISLLLCGCSSHQPEDTSSETPTFQQPEIEEKQEQIGHLNSVYICETQDYWYYLNVYNNYTLCRYNKKTNDVTLIFDKNIGKFLHTIKVYNNRLFFVTRTENDDGPVLYSSDLDGKNVVKVLENVGDHYFFKGDTIYYTSYREKNGAIFYIYEFNMTTGKNTLLVNREAVSLAMVGDIIYFVDISFDMEANYSAGAIKALDTVSGKTKNIALPTGITYVSRLRYCNNKLFINCRAEGRKGAIIASVDLSTNIFLEEWYMGPESEWDILEYEVLSEKQIYCYARKLISVDQNGNHFWECHIIQTENGEHNKYTAFNIPQNGGTMGVFEGKPIIFDVSKGDNAKIHGAEKLNVKINDIESPDNNSAVL